MEDPTNKGEESSKKVPATSSSSSGRRGKEVSVNTVNTAQQAPQQYSMNYTAAPPVAPSYTPHAPQYRPQPPTQPIYYSALPPPPLPTVSSPVVHHYTPAPSQAPQYQPPAPRTSQPTQRAPPPQGQQGEGEQGWPSPFVIEYVPAEAAVGFAGIDAPQAPLVIDIPAREPYSNDRVPWTYEGGVVNLEQQFGVMGITSSGRLYENPTTTDKGNAPATEVETRPRTLPTPSKKVTEEEAEAFMKIIKASEYKVVEQMAKSLAHISLLALLLNLEPHREALMRTMSSLLKDARIPGHCILFASATTTSLAES
ncbi:pollen-specific leucine-rich repeat extensin-like protein 1 [Punica granatum]|uniref:Pollen-specific leucine-rich repeat extensin-like protein 1 n=1 Tax=Punica granatum TaxID=22663 RepID=A0A6P8CTJ5_PUNGR|nr:pollen-specific leucine-rich repeat extensin-like protein 1 [Punica granatum]